MPILEISYPDAFHFRDLHSMSGRTFLLCVLLLFSGTSVAEAQKPDISFKHISVEQGLPHHTANDIFEDRKGFVWISSFGGGLSRYDGRQFKHFRHNPADTNSLSNDIVANLREGPDGMIWIVAGGRLNRLNPETEKMSRINLGELDGRLNNFYIDENNNLWLAAGSQLFLYATSNRKIEEILLSESHALSPRNDIDVILPETDRKLWIVAKNGLHLLKLADTTSIHYPFHFRGPRDLDAIKSRDGMIWIGGRYEGLVRFDTEKERFSKPYVHDPSNPNSLSHSAALAVWEDSKGRLWIGTDGGALNLFDRENEVFYRYLPDPSNPDSFQGRNIMDIAEDRAGNIWVGTHDAGINIIPKHSDPVKYFPPYQGKGSGLTGRFTKLHMGNDGRIWIALDDEGGLNVFDPKTEIFQAYRHDPNRPGGLPGDKVTHLFQDRNGWIWLTSTLWGTGKFLPEKNLFYRYRPDPNKPYSIPRGAAIGYFEDAKKRLWLRFITPNGLVSVIYQDSLDSFLPVEGYFQGMASDHRGDILVFAENGEGIDRIDIETFERTRLVSGVSGLSMLEDQRKRLWVAGQFELLCVDLEKDTILRYGREAGLADGGMGGILEDDHGNIWISGYNGIFKIHAQTDEVELIRNDYRFTYSFNQPGSALKDADGTFYFGGYNGFISFHPDSIYSQARTLKALITDFHYSDRSLVSSPKTGVIPGRSLQTVKGISYKEKLDLEFRQRDFVIDFSSTEFIEPERVSYRFRLENYHQNWLRTDASNRRAIYTNLAPGEYRFRVQATLDGEWPREDTSIIIRILRPWWQTWWAYATYVFAALAAIYLTFRWRTRSLRRQQQLLRARVLEQTQAIRAEKERSDELLLNILPAKVAEELKETGKTQPVFFEEVSIMFIDFEGFTNIVATIPGKKLVTELDDIFQAYDDIMEEAGLEKIQTIGDGYLVAGGLPTPDPAHAKKCVIAAKRIIAYLKERNQTEAVKWKARIGIHSGSITAGVIGKKKFSYSLFGDTINVAARLEATSEAGRINVSAITYDLIRDRFACAYRGKIDAKGKGELDMYFVNETE